MPSPVVISREEAAAFLVGHLGLTRRSRKKGAAGAREMLRKLRCIQLDPLDPIGTNADLVLMARVGGVGRGDVHRFLYPGHAFEHFAKERCLLPPYAFPWYRGRLAQTPWWRLQERLDRIPESLIATVHEEIRLDGPMTPDEVRDHGVVNPIDWAGWKSTSRATVMAIEVLWTRCEIVVCGRTKNSKLYDVPERALPNHAAPHEGDFDRWALLERVEAAGLLSRAGGAHWSMLSDVRTSRLPDQMIEAGEVEEVQIEGASRRYLAPAGFRRRRFPKPDGEMRILGPLDPLIWDRNLVKHVFGFDYVWEVYKPANLRRWGWYVCPLLQGNRLVGRIDAAIEKGKLRVRKIWREAHSPLDEAALDAVLARHAEGCGVDKVARSRKILMA
jgi:uncharacterized protein YcaQ